MSNDRCSQCPLILVVAGVAVLIICVLAQVGVIANAGGKVQAGSFFSGLGLLGAGVIMRVLEHRLGPQ